MPNWSSIFNEVRKSQNLGEAIERKRREFLSKIASITGRNVITYYSAWLKSPELPGISIDEQDKNAFMNADQGLTEARGST